MSDQPAQPRLKIKAVIKSSTSPSVNPDSLMRSVLCIIIFYNKLLMVQWAHRGGDKLLSTSPRISHRRCVLHGVCSSSGQLKLHERVSNGCGPARLCKVVFFFSTFLCPSSSCPSSSCSCSFLLYILIRLPSALQVVCRFHCQRLLVRLWMNVKKKHAIIVHSIVSVCVNIFSIYFPPYL